MTTPDPNVAALIRLCEREGGYKAVAARARLSAQNLWQITAGIKHPSGRARGVGPKVRDKLAQAYPGWNDADTPISPATEHSRILALQFEQLPHDRKLRAEVFTECSLAIGRALQRITAARSDTPAGQIHPDTQVE